MKPIKCKKLDLLCVIILLSLQYRVNCVWPEIYILGAQKSGTTSLYDLIVQKKQICQANCTYRSKQCFSTKEIHFFDVLDRFSKGSETYTSLFPKSKCIGRFIDGTPDYFHTDKVPERMASMIPENIRKKLKFVISLREPIDRDFSMFEHLLRGCSAFLQETHKSTSHQHICGNRYCYHTAKICHKNIKFSNNDLTNHRRLNVYNFTTNMIHNNSSDQLYHHRKLKLASSLYISYDEFVQFRLDTHLQSPSPTALTRGLYYSQLLKFLQIFDRKQFFIISFSSLLLDTTNIANRLARFLGMSSGYGEKVLLPHDNASNGPRAVAVLKCTTKRRLEMLYKSDTTKLYEMMRNKLNSPPDEPHFVEFGSSKVTCV
mmetsp:Transcript_33931/g.34568  ORF Transcript_33931/g.34568 Transcript_33931/m.34568 type:complete len:373 (+) Transcript_33931:3-1121(+)